jgi:hypothetical protein
MNLLIKKKIRQLALTCDLSKNATCEYDMLDNKITLFNP